MISAQPATTGKPVRAVLFLCTGNSARSILAEALLAHLGKGRFAAFSAGSHPAGEVNPLALSLLREKGLPTDTMRSKSWEEFERPGAPSIDIAVTLCDSARREACPVWPGRPVSCHWGIPDPAAATGAKAEIHAAFETAFGQLSRRIAMLLELPIDALEPNALETRLNWIGDHADEI